MQQRERLKLMRQLLRAIEFTTDAIERLSDREQSAALADLLELRDILWETWDIFALEEIAVEEQSKLDD